VNVPPDTGVPAAGVTAVVVVWVVVTMDVVVVLVVVCVWVWVVVCVVVGVVVVLQDDSTTAATSKTLSPNHTSFLFILSHSFFNFVLKMYPYVYI
jgi:hypothetical protein